jgi:DNA-binding NarL/FixJ family response regulator
MEAVTFLVVNSEPLTRFGVARLISEKIGWRVAAEAGSHVCAVAAVDKCRPDIAIIDAIVHGGCGFELTRSLRKLHSALRVVVTGTSGTAEQVQRAFRAGARAYVSRLDSSTELLRAIDKTLRNELFASESVSEGLLRGLCERSRVPALDPLCGLSDRESLVFRMIGAGHGMTRIASELNLSVKTVETHRQRIKQKLGCTSSAALARRAIEWLTARDAQAAHRPAKSRS